MITERQRQFAFDIADELGLELPDDNEVSDFIAENKAEFYRCKRDRQGNKAFYDDLSDRRFYEKVTVNQLSDNYLSMGITQA